MPENSRTASPMDTVAGFWQDFFDKMGCAAGGGAGAPPAFANEMSKQMQRMFFDAMAKYCDDFMRSEQFLTMMKQTMDRSLAFKRQMDQFLEQVQQGLQVPSRVDIDDLAGTLRGIEQRVLDRLEALEKKIESLEGADHEPGHRPAARTAAGRRK